jgi:regulator of RNase E activity RraA
MRLSRIAIAHRHGLPVGGNSMAESLTADELDRFRKLDSVALFFARAQVEGYISEDFTGPEIHCMFPELGPAVGYAATSEWTTLDPESPDLNFLDYYEWITTLPEPRFVISLDADSRAGRSAAFGDMQARTLRRLGVAGVISGTGLHKATMVRKAGMPVWTTGVAPGHGSYHLIRYGAPVTVGRVEWKVGDLVFADESGAIRIPPELARATLEKAETDGKGHLSSYFEVIDAPDFTIAKMRAWLAKHPTMYPHPDPATRERWWAEHGKDLAPRGSGVAE